MSPEVIEAISDHSNCSFSRYGSTNCDVDAYRAGFDVSVSRALAAVSGPLGSSFRQGAAASRDISNQRSPPPCFLLP